MRRLRRFLYQPKGRANETHAFIAGRSDGLYAINHASGCSHGCRYPCYAQMRQQTLHGRTYDDWLKPNVFIEAEKIVRKELVRLFDARPEVRSSKVKDVELCFTTDPYMYGNEVMRGVTNDLIDVLVGNMIGVTVLTKGNLFDATNNGDPADCDIKYGISLVTLSDLFSKEFEPGAALPKARIAGLGMKHDEGFDTWVSIEPFPPTSLRTHSVEEILRAVPFVDKAIFGRWNYAGFKDQSWYEKGAADFERTCLELGIEGKVKNDIKDGAAHA